MSSHQCPDCNLYVPQYGLKAHIRSCQKFTPLFLKQIDRLPRDLTISQLKFILAQLDIARQNVQNQMLDYHQQIMVPVKVNGKKSEKIQEPALMDINAFDSQIIQCKNCKRKFYASFDVSSLFYVEECWHLFCIPCIRKYIDEQFINQGGNLTCLVKGCGKNIPEYQIKNMVGQEKFQTMQNKAIRKMMNIIQCFKCKSEFEFVPGNPKDAPKKDANGKNLTAQHAKHYAQNRLVCPNCKTEQCRDCQATPFHLAMTCKQFKVHAMSQKCRYCDEPLTDKNTIKTVYKAHEDICSKYDCQQLAKTACTKMLGCGHACCGYRNQQSCLPCLNEKCSQNNPQLNGQKGDDYCAICYVEALSASPCIRSACGHVFHLKCLQKRFEIKWLTPRILFNFCLCPLCKKWIQVSEDCPLYKPVVENLQLLKNIQKMALDRLKFEQEDKSEKLKDKASPYYQKPVEYAMAVYAYFLCFKCKKPYFGGRKSCADAIVQNPVDYKKEDLVCPGCCQIPTENCPKHGKDFIQFKCKFCCSIAQWFCWGNTHFCDPCHKRQCNGDYVSKYPKQKLPVCPGPEKCPIGGKHSGNGQQKQLGCAICRNFKENSKAF